MSLVEVILLIVIIGIVAYPLSQLSVVNLRSEAKYTAIERAAFDARCIMEQVLSDYGTTARGYNWVRTNWNNMTGTTIS